MHASHWLGQLKELWDAKRGEVRIYGLVRACEEKYRVQRLYLVLRGASGELEACKMSSMPAAPAYEGRACSSTTK